MILKTEKRKRRHQKSYQARNVALDVLDCVRKKKPVNLLKIQMKNGYTRASAKSYTALQAESFKETLAPVINRMENLRDKIMSSLQNRDYDKEKTFDAIMLLKNLNHDIELLGGRSTENLNHSNNLIIFGSDDFLSLQMEKRKLRESGDTTQTMSHNVDCETDCKADKEL